MTVGHMKLQSRDKSLLWRRSHLPVSPRPTSCKNQWYTNLTPGLQTPRLKRLAEIVSAQALAQQERLEYELDANGIDDADGDDGYRHPPQGSDGEIGLGINGVHHPEEHDHYAAGPPNGHENHDEQHYEDDEMRQQDMHSKTPRGITA